MKTIDIKKKDTSELPKLATELRMKLRDFRFNMGGSKVKNIREGREIKKAIARVLTEMNMRKIAAKTK
jgi:ribosomal protein L29